MIYIIEYPFGFSQKRMCQRAEMKDMVQVDAKSTCAIHKEIFNAFDYGCCSKMPCCNSIIFIRTLPF